VATSIKVRFAEAAAVEYANDKQVAIFTINAEKEDKDAVNLKISTKATGLLIEARQMFGKCVGPAITPTLRSNGEYYFVGPIGTYEVGISLFGDGQQAKLVIADVPLGNPPPLEPDKPTEPEEPDEPPVEGGLEQLYKFVFDKVKAMQDPATAKSLASAYTQALEASVGKTKEETAKIVNEATMKVLRERVKPKIGWDMFISEVNGQLRPLSADVASYRTALSILVKAMVAGS
jgi:hypothetical protein